MVLSTASCTAMEEVAGASGDGQRWFQLYWPKDQAVAASFLARAKAAGFTALVITLDTRMLAWRPRDLDQAFQPFLRGIGIQNYLTTRKSSQASLAALAPANPPAPADPAAPPPLSRLILTRSPPTWRRRSCSSGGFSATAR